MNYVEKLSEARGSLNVLKKQYQAALKISKKLRILMDDGILPAQALIQTVAQETQSRVQVHIKNIVQLALDAVFPDKYEFMIDFELKRGKTEASLYLLKNTEHYDPMFSNGGGVVDILALALRISAYTLSNNRNIVILDEPMRFVSEDLQEDAATIIKHLSEKINLQFLISTHSEEIINIADKSFRASMIDDTYTQITESS